MTLCLANRARMACFGPVEVLFPNFEARGSYTEECQDDSEILTKKLAFLGREKAPKSCPECFRQVAAPDVTGCGRASDRLEANFGQVGSKRQSVCRRWLTVPDLHIKGISIVYCACKVHVYAGFPGRFSRLPVFLRGGCKQKRDFAVFLLHGSS